MLGIARRGLRLTTGLVLGAVIAVAELPFVVLSGLSLLCVFAWPRGRRAVLKPVTAAARALTETHRRRLRIYVAADTSDAYADLRALQYLSLRWGLSLLGVLVLSAALIGLAYGISWIFILLLNDVRHPGDLAISSVVGLFLLFLSLQGTFGVAGLETRLARYYLGPSHHEELERRIEQLATSRAGVIAAVNDERRRIERDLQGGTATGGCGRGGETCRGRGPGDPSGAGASLGSPSPPSRHGQRLSDGSSREGKLSGGRRAPLVSPRRLAAPSGDRPRPRSLIKGRASG
ncbi:hypothetical protein [Streptomyces tubercidicus]|uniref:hypothetical protein n=1 Tax=Streptomyces tubercidicus TaxID=47759 RepID=UPI003465D10A